MWVISFDSTKGFIGSPFVFWSITVPSKTGIKVVPYLKIVSFANLKKYPPFIRNLHVTKNYGWFSRFN